MRVWWRDFAKASSKLWNHREVRWWDRDGDGDRGRGKGRWGREGETGEQFVCEATFATYQVVPRMEQQERRSKRLVSWAYADNMHLDAARWQDLTWGQRAPVAASPQGCNLPSPGTANPPLLPGLQKNLGRQELCLPQVYLEFPIVCYLMVFVFLLHGSAGEVELVIV